MTVISNYKKDKFNLQLSKSVLYFSFQVKIINLLV